MTEKELIELAAEAAGLSMLGCWDEESGCLKYPHRSDLTNAHLWNPLTDDGDALRLANKLRLDIHNDQAFAVCGRSGITEFRVDVDIESDVNAATCRAIVLAAVEIANLTKMALVTSQNHE